MKYFNNFVHYTLFICALLCFTTILIGLAVTPFNRLDFYDNIIAPIGCWLVIDFVLIILFFFGLVLIYLPRKVGDLAESKGYSWKIAFIESLLFTPFFFLLYYGFVPNKN